MERELGLVQRGHFMMGGGIVNEENWFNFPGKFTLKLVRFSRKKVPISGLIFLLQHGGKKCSIPVQFSTRLPDHA